MLRYYCEQKEMFTHVHIQGLSHLLLVAVFSAGGANLDDPRQGRQGRQDILMREKHNGGNLARHATKFLRGKIQAETRGKSSGSTVLRLN